MKRLSAILIGSMYLLLTTGFTVNIHYCMGQVESVSFIPFADSCCCDTGNMQNGCCGNDLISLQYSPNEQLLANYTPEFKADLFEIIDFAWVESLEISNQQDKVSYYNKPPPSAQIPLWLKHSTFIFYG